MNRSPSAVRRTLWVRIVGCGGGLPMLWWKPNGAGASLRVELDGDGFLCL